MDFSGIPAGPGLAYFWDFGDGSVSTLPNPSHLYQQSGNFIATLTVFNADSCFSEFSRSIQVFEQPTAAFEWSRSDSCGGPDSISFNNLSSGNLLAYRWKFGDGDSSTQVSPQHVYTQAGVYPVELIASTAFACSDTFRDTITVYVQPQGEVLPVPARGCAPLLSQIQVNASGFTDFRFDFGDGTETTLPFSSQNHLYDAQSGNQIYEAVLYLGYEGFCFDTVRRLISVNSRPLAEFSPLVDSICGAPANLSFDNQSTDAIGGLQYRWLFGDGGNSIETSPTYTFSQTGVFEVQLIAENDSSCRDTAFRRVVVLPQPLAQIIVDQDLGCYDLPVSFRLGQPDSASAWRWDFGDGTQTSGSDAPQHVYRDEGEFVVTVEIDTAGFCFAQASDTIRVGAPPVANFVIDTIVGECADSVFVELVNTSFNADAFRWDFDDGRRSSEFEPDLFYTQPDSYRVALIAINSDFGCRDTVDQLIPYLRAIADFELTPLGGCTDLAVVPNNLSIGANTYSWDFGDGTIRDPRESPTHIYRQAGEYTVTLYASFSGVCRDTFAFPVPVSVSQSPVARIAAAPLSPPGNWLFSDSSTVFNPPYAVRWDFGDGFGSDREVQSHQFEGCDLVNVSLTISDNLGCRDTALLEDFDTGTGTLFFPNALAPNAGQGDFAVFWPRGSGLDTLHIAIYNKWGNLVWERRSHNELGGVNTYPGLDGQDSTVLDNTGAPYREVAAWDGRLEGRDGVRQPVMPGVYTWVIHNAWYCNGREYVGPRQGSVTVLAGDR